MKHSLPVWGPLTIIGVAAAYLTAAQVARGATSSLSPAVISNTYSGYFTLQVDGLANGETVAVQNYFDINGNGILDSADMLMEAYRITDGLRMLIGGATNVNIPADFGGTNGSITVYFPYMPSRPQLGMGKHLIRVSSPIASFPALTNSLVITNWLYPQSISGTVTCSSTNVPYAVVVLLTASPDGTGDLAALMVADGSGAYAVRAPVGDYQVLAFRPGYVFSAATGPQVSLSSGASVVANLTLVPATQPFAAAVVDAGDTNIPIPGLFTILQSASGFIAVSTTDKSGSLSASVVPDGWQVNLDSTSLAPLGYVSSQNAPAFDTTAAAVTNALIKLTKGTAMIYGTIRNAANAPLGGISFWANNDNNALEATGWSDPAGNYSVAVSPGVWWSGPDTMALPANSIVGGTDQRTLASGQAVRQDVVVVQATTTIHGTVKNTQGQPVGGVNLWCNAQQNGVNFNANAQTDGNGNYSLSAFNGSWNVGFQCWGNGGLPDLGYQCPFFNSTVLIPPASPVLNFTLTPLGAPELGPPSFTSAGHAVITLYGLPGTHYVVQYTTNVTDAASWRTLITFVAAGQVNNVPDDHATNKARFYRARIWP